MAIDKQNPLAYELLSMVILEFEEQALEEESRDSLMAVSNGPLSAMELALDGSETALRNIKNTRSKMNDGEGGKKEKRWDEIVVDLGLEAEFDKDLMAALGEGDGALADYIARCPPCNLRLQFDWQLQPFALLGPINAFIDDMLATLERFKNRADPFNLFKDLCWLLDLFKDFCIQDLLMLIMALKLLFKKYLLQLFNIKIDWTLLLGPLLKFIIEGIATLLEQIVGIILAPIDCALSVLYTANNILLQTQQLLNDVTAFGAGVGQGIGGLFGKEGDINNLTKNAKNGQFPLGIEGNTTYRDAKWIKPNKGIPDENRAPKDIEDEDGPPDYGFLQTRDHRGAEKQIEDGSTFLTGFELKQDMTLEEALADPFFSERSTVIEKIIVPVQEARNWIRELFDNIIEALLSIRGLVSGGLGLSLDFLGILMFILDMIALVGMIIKILSLKINVNSYCDLLQENPELVEQLFRSRFGENIRAIPQGEGLDSEIVLRQGPDIVGRIRTCTNKRTDQDSQIIDQWIRDIQAKGQT